MSDKVRALLTGQLSARLLTVSALLILTACSGVHITPADTEAFAATNYTRYAWRSAPPSTSPSGNDMTARKSPSIRAGVEARMSELGYRLVDRSDAQFLVEYVAAPGISDGQLSHGGSNDLLYGSSVNRQIDGATADNAYALSGPVETRETELLFIDATTVDVLWRVRISMIVEDSNRIDQDEVRRAVRKAISALPPAN